MPAGQRQPRGGAPLRIDGLQQQSWEGVKGAHCPLSLTLKASVSVHALMQVVHSKIGWSLAGLDGIIQVLSGQLVAVAVHAPSPL